MNTIQKRTDEIRDLINAYPKQTELLKNTLKWHKLCASLDTIEDTNTAIEFYTTLKDFDATNGGYLYLYGLFQALYLQQDSLDSLSLALLNKKIIWEKEYPILYEIRELRNDVFGHPTDREHDKRFHVISRPTINKTHCEIIDYLPGERNNFRSINMEDVIKDQSILAINILTSIKKELENG